MNLIITLSGMLFLGLIVFVIVIIAERGNGIFILFLCLLFAFTGVCLDNYLYSVAENPQKVLNH